MKVIAVVFLAFVLCNAQSGKPERCTCLPCQSPYPVLRTSYHSDATVIYKLTPPEIPPGMETVLVHVKDALPLENGSKINIFCDVYGYSNLTVLATGPGTGDIMLLVTKEEARTIRVSKTLRLWSIQLSVQLPG